APRTPRRPITNAIGRTPPHHNACETLAVTPETLTYAVADRIARITLNRPERGNGITRLLVTELERCVEQADLDPAVHVILLSGNGKGFCGGYDLVESAEGQGRMGNEVIAAPA